jgi:hypothetical protein
MIQFCCLYSAAVFLIFFFCFFFLYWEPNLTELFAGTHRFLLSCVLLTTPSGLLEYKQEVCHLDFYPFGSTCYYNLVRVPHFATAFPVRIADDAVTSRCFLAVSPVATKSLFWEAAQNLLCSISRVRDEPYPEDILFAGKLLKNYSLPE